MRGALLTFALLAACGEPERPAPRPGPYVAVDLAAETVLRVEADRFTLRSPGQGPAILALDALEERLRGVPRLVLVAAPGARPAGIAAALAAAERAGIERYVFQVE